MCFVFACQKLLFFSPQKAASKLGQELLFRRRRLDALTHTTLNYQQRLDELRIEEERRNQEHTRAATSVVASEFELEEDAMVVYPLISKNVSSFNH